MTQEEINNYLQLQSAIITGKNDVASYSLSLKIAREEAKVIEASLKAKEVEVNYELYSLEKSALKESYNTENAALSALQSNITDLQGQLTSLQEAETQISESITTTQNSLDAKSEELVTLQEQPQSRTRDQQIAIVEGEISSLEETMDGLLAQLSANDASQTSLQDEINILDAEITQQSQRTTDAQSALNNKIAEFGPSQLELDGVAQSLTVKQTDIGNLADSLQTAEEGLNSNTVAYSEISDPTSLIEAINDDTPFMLLPVRLETRFMTIKHVKRFDDLSGLDFEQTESEIPQIDSNDPEVVPDKNELWIRIYPDDIAIHIHEQRLTIDEQDAGKTYWEGIWELDYNGSLTENDKLGHWRALVDSFGPERAAWIKNQTEPTNLNVNPLPQNPIFPTLVLKTGTWTDQPVTKVMPDRFVARLFPTGGAHREVIGNQILDPLPLGINPSSTDLDDQFDQENKRVVFPQDIKWLSDFNEAEAVGMGIRIPLMNQEATQGFDKILLLGVKLAASKSDSKDLLEELIDNHHYTSGGFSLVTQGTPTNNTEDVESGYESYEIGKEDSFATEVGAPLFQTTTDRFNKTDGQWFSEMIGVSDSTMHHIRNADKYDQREEMAMNAALWPATMGYYINQMLSPIVFTKQQKDVRAFHCDHVSARGRIPAFRVKNQPYGVLASTAFSKWKYPTMVATNSQEYTIKRMYEDILVPLNNEFANLVDQVLHSESTGVDAQEKFLKVLGLHASSVEFHQRFSGGQHFSWNVLQYFRNAPTAGTGEEILEMNETVPEALRNILDNTVGFNLPISPRILKMLFAQKERLLNGPVIDLDARFPFSESRSIQDFPDTTTNYVEWLLMSDYNAIRTENFNNIQGVQSGQKPPKALLYLLLRHAYLLEHLNAAMDILAANNITQPEAAVEYELHKDEEDTTISLEEENVLKDLVTAELTLAYEIDLENRIQIMIEREEITPSNAETKKEQLRADEAEALQDSINTELDIRKENFSVEQVKWDYLDQIVEDVTGEDTLLQHILSTLSLSDPYTGYLAKVEQALNIIKDMPTARLERCLAESLDICNYRLDAWMLGAVNKRLEEQMEAARQSNNPGSFIGAYGIIDGLKPNADFPGIFVEQLESQAELTSELYVYYGTDSTTMLELDQDVNEVVSPPRVNTENLGFIHGPSMNHAVTAAVLRAGYAGHQGTASPDSAMAVNLRSDRVRKALFYIEGIRNGQDLASLLGYKFERGLHDMDAQLDQYILDIRRLFPLVANGLVPDDASVSSIEAFEARNVVDGVKLLEAYRANPTSWQSTLTIPASDLTLINNQIIEVIEHLDALGDLMLAEGVFQLATGNHERAGAAIKSLGEGKMIPEPQIIQTPRLDKVFMQRHAVLFDTATANALEWSNPASPRSYCEPSLNSWIASVLPDPSKVIINYEYTTFDTGGNPVITQAQMQLSELDLQPIDFIALIVDQSGSENGTEFSSLINYLGIHTVSNTEVPLSIKFIDRAGLANDQLTIFEILPLARSIQQIIGQGRTAKPEDFLIEGDVYNVMQSATLGQGFDLAPFEGRLTELLGPSTGGPDGIVDIKANIISAMVAADALTDMTGNEAVLDSLRNTMLTATKFSCQGAIPSNAADYTLAVRDEISAQAVKVIAQLQSKEDEVTQGLSDLTSLTDVNDRLEKLQEIAQAMFGRNFKTFPEFNFFNTVDLDLSLGNADLLSNAGDFALEEWLHGVSKVRPKMGLYHMKSMLQESINDNSPNLDVVQLPIVSNLNDRWLGAELPAGYETPDQAISIVFERSASHSTANLQSGIVLDDWTESIPDPNVISGIALNYDQPNNEAPNTLILAVTPEVTGNWTWDDLMGVVDDTLTMAKQRAIDPDIINTHSVLGHALPALFASVEGTDSAPGLDFSRNIVDANNGQVGPIDLQQYTTQSQSQ